MCPQYTIPILVVASSFCFIMLRSIQFNDQLCLCAVEVHNILFNRTLTHNANRVIPQKLIPEFSFLRRHVFTEFSGKCGLLFVFHIPLYNS